jgi:hypothetical protein
MNISVEPIYPSLPQKVIVNQDEFERKFRETIFRERTNEIKQQRQKVEEQLNHFLKIKKRWTTADNILKHTGFSLVLVSGAAATILTSFITVGFSIPAIAILSITGASLVHSSLIEGVVTKITSKRKRKYINRINHLQSYLDKTYILYEKARSNGAISNAELEAIRNISVGINIKKNNEILADDLLKNSQLQSTIEKLENDFRKVKESIPTAPNASRVSLFV